IRSQMLYPLSSGRPPLREATAANDTGCERAEKINAPAATTTATTEPRSLHRARVRSARPT
ncbi:MAG: hypothetical protein ACR2JX_06120, partial [Mycobacteriales bacterium]